ncbi:MAG: hypothetical protein NT096_10900 [Proteobacteria bacterium]|nr:hypothetical protein [Pseudomonadota bacterium]
MTFDSPFLFTNTTHLREFIPLIVHFSRKVKIKEAIGTKQQAIRRRQWAIERQKSGVRRNVESKRQGLGLRKVEGGRHEISSIWIKNSH